MANLVALLGVAVLIGAATALSTDRKRIRWRAPLMALALQLVIASVFFLFPGRKAFFGLLNTAVLKVIDCGGEGVRFLFGHLATPPPEGQFVLAIHALPLVIFFAALVSLLYHLGVMQRLLSVLAKGLSKLLGLSGAEALVAASNIFVGVEATTSVRPYLAQMTQSELFLILTAGMSTIASTVLALYVSALQGQFPEIAVHLISASFLSAPAAVCMAKVMCPETGDPLTLGKVVEPDYRKAGNVIESILNGANDGVRMLLGIVSALIAFIGIVALVNLFLGGIGHVCGAESAWTVQGLLAYVYYPFIAVLGVPSGDIMDVARLVGDRLVLTEVPSYFALGAMAAEGALEARSVLVASYVLCGFAHVASLGIFVGGAGALAPERLPDLGKIGIRALIAANLACLMTGAMASLFYHPGVQVLVSAGP